MTAAQAVCHRPMNPRAARDRLRLGIPKHRLRMEIGVPAAINQGRTVTAFVDTDSKYFVSLLRLRIQRPDGSYEDSQSELLGSVFKLADFVCEHIQTDFDAQDRPQRVFVNLF